MNFYTIPNRVQYKQPFYFVCESESFSPDANYILYQINNASTVLSSFQPNCIFSTLPNNHMDHIHFATDSIGDLYASSLENNIIYKYNKIDKVFEHFITATLVSPKGFVFDNDNYLYVSNTTKEKNGRISVFDSNGTFLYDIFSEWLSSPGDIKRDKIGNIYIINENALDLPCNISEENFNPNSKYNGSYLLLQVIPNNNTLSGTVNLFCYQSFCKPTSIAFDSKNNGYICNSGSNSISIIDMVTGDADIYIPKGAGLIHPRSITFDKKDNLYVTMEDKEFQIQKITKQKLLTTFASQCGNNPINLFCDRNDQLFVGNNDGQIFRITCNRFLFRITHPSLSVGNHPLIIYDDKKAKTVVSSLSVQIIGDSQSILPSYSKNKMTDRFRMGSTRRLMWERRGNYTRRR